MANGDMIKRKYLAHYLDVSFGGVTAYERIGKDLEEYKTELNPDVKTTKNILGETSNRVTGYDPSSNVDPYYAEEGSTLGTHLAVVANTRDTGSALATTMVDVLVDSTAAVVWAYREDVLVIPQSIGGDNSGVQIPYEIRNNGNRVSGTWNTATKTFTPAA